MLRSVRLTMLLQEAQHGSEHVLSLFEPQHEGSHAWLKRFRNSPRDSSSASVDGA
jgi:hypothetical protein